MDLTLGEPDPIAVLELFPSERGALLELLASIEPSAWQLPTVCPGWSVKDLVAHLLADDLARLSDGRDGQRMPGPRHGESLASYINRRNEEWVAAARRLSPRTLRMLLGVTGPATRAWFESLDLHSAGAVVSWAGPDPAPVWLDLAREFTERWHHHQQIRDAVGAAPLNEPRLLRPVLETFAFALPQTFRELEAVEGTTVSLSIEGPSGGAWTVVRRAARWLLRTGEPVRPTARVTIDEDAAWRLFTKGISPGKAAAAARLEGDQGLASRVLRTVAIIA